MATGIPGVPADLNAIIRQLEQRIQNLESASRLYNSSIREGTLRIQDANGNPRVTIGKMDDGHYGIVAYSTGAIEVFRVDERGLNAPLNPLPQNYVPGGITPYVQVISGAGFGLISRSLMPPVISHQAVRIYVGYQVDPGSVGQIRALARQVVAGPDPIFATTTSVNVSGTGTMLLDWLHPFSMGPAPGTTFYYIDVEGGIVLGTGNFQGYEPSVTLINDSYGATTGGVWQNV